MPFSLPPTGSLLGLGLFALWAVGEGAIHLWRLYQPEQPTKRRAALGWLQSAYAASLTYGLVDGALLRWTPTPRDAHWLAYAGAATVVLGLAVRFAARIALGRNFSAFVQTCDTHRLVTTGPYRWVRHPAYTGFLLMLAGFPACFGSWGGWAIGLGIGLPAIAWRIRAEEAALRDWFGAAYSDYTETTWRLVPFVW